MTHFLTVADFDSSTLNAIVENARILKYQQKSGISHRLLEGKGLAMIFEKPSNRTRIAFEMGIFQLGGYSIFLQKQDVGMGDREPIKDVARVLSRMTDVVMIRALSHHTLDEFSRYATVPVINGLSDTHHPCQAMADMVTILEKKPDHPKPIVAYVGDGNNVCRSLIEICQKMNVCIRVACPKGYEPSIRPDFLSHSPREVVDGADVVYTDVWISMGQESDCTQKMNDFKEFTVTKDLMACAKSDAIFMHCLPAIRGQEVDDEVIESSQSAVFDQAENRLHAHKAILMYLLESNLKK